MGLRQTVTRHQEYLEEESRVTRLCQDDMISGCLVRESAVNKTAIHPGCSRQFLPNLNILIDPWRTLCSTPVLNPQTRNMETHLPSVKGRLSQQRSYSAPHLDKQQSASQGLFGISEETLANEMREWKHSLQLLVNKRRN